MNKQTFLENLRRPSRFIVLLILFLTCSSFKHFSHRSSKRSTKELVFVSSESNFKKRPIQIVNTSDLGSGFRRRLVSSTHLLMAIPSETGKNYTVAPSEVNLNNKKYFIWGNVIFLLLVICPMVLYYRSTLKNLIRSKKETEEQNNDLTVANKELYRFVYSASHDLRSPINSVKGLIEIAQEEENVHKIKDYLNLMHESLTQQDHFISDIIDYSRNKRKHQCIELVSLDKLTDEIISQHLYMKKANSITFKKDISADKIIIDSLRVRIILNNLLSNAIKYSDDNKHNKVITIKTYENRSFYVIEIEDNGIGINRENQDKIFDMFFVTNEKMGSGLGLFIAKEAAECLNGNIAVHSEKNIGTTFTVALPKLEINQV
ncbi:MULTISPECIES: sensor histidine kinase [Flavobacterium]|uniref:sensor histidine kinase n=1 Tax=Flavobacterium TaxID=237 RepID=UPI001FCBB6AC|nr:MULTISPECIES: HAMP domain-containing sensor histidine kinase [Flavobacterium]UOK42444.1 HAMP domain-containing histidine kinase [Flavobacterium enshiense]